MVLWPNDAIVWGQLLCSFLGLPFRVARGVQQLLASLSHLTVSLSDFTQKQRLIQRLVCSDSAR